MKVWTAKAEPGDRRLYFNGVLNQASSSSYLHDPCTPEQLLAHVGSAPIFPPPGTKGLPATVDPENLEQAGWAVLWAPGLDPQIRQNLAPLLKMRRCQANGLFREVELRPRETYFQLLMRLGASVAPVDPKFLPYYLLLVGDPDLLSFELQYQLDVAHAVGRISFATPQEYGRYAESVVDAETAPRLPRRLTIFSVVNEDDPATESCGRDFTQPLMDSLARERDWRTEGWFGGDATSARLRSILTENSPPALLLTCSHGLMFHPDDPLHATDQGAILCADWPGPERWKSRIPPEFYMAARDIPDHADLGAAILFHFACFSAGTPERDNFSRELGQPLPRRARRDMVAPLVQRLLGKPGAGALAVVGHVDQVFVASFLWPEIGRQLATFEGCFQALMRGKRLGHALDVFGQRHASIATLITGRLEHCRKNPKECPEGISGSLGEAFLWLAHNDARGYVLMGDPAVRAPVSA